MRKQLNPSTDDESAFVTPRLANLLSAANADQVVRGMRLHLQTKALLPDNVGNALNCTSCHLNAGTVADGSPFVGVSAFFPSYAPRAGKDVTLEERINGCFRRSMDGKPLPVASIAPPLDVSTPLPNVALLLNCATPPLSVVLPLTNGPCNVQVPLLMARLLKLT